MHNEKYSICSCGESYDFEGWNIHKIKGMGNNYHYKGTKCYIIKYTFCDKCGEKVILSKKMKVKYLN